MRIFISDTTYGFKVSRVIVPETDTGFQKLMILETDRFGRVLVLDGIVQLTEEDEGIYHEWIAHWPLFALRKPAQHVLIIGGGDCGVAREVLRHKSVKRVTMVEIDRMVCDLTRQHMPSVCEGVYEDPRFKLIIGDGAEVIRQMKGKCDVIVIDSTDPIGPAQSLFNTDFYQSVYDALTDGGITIHQTGALILQPFEAPGSWRQIERSFDDVRVVQFANVSYMGGPFSLTAGSKGKGVFKNAERNALKAYKKAGFKTSLVFAADLRRPLSRIPETPGDRQVRRGDRHGHRSARGQHARRRPGGQVGYPDLRGHQDEGLRQADLRRLQAGRREHAGAVRGDQRHQLPALRAGGGAELLHLRRIAGGGRHQDLDRFFQVRKGALLAPAARLIRRYQKDQEKYPHLRIRPRRQQDLAGLPAAPGRKCRGLFPRISRFSEEKGSEEFELVMDIYDCEYDKIASSPAAVARWAGIEFPKMTGLKTVGKADAPDFGHAKKKTAGPSVVQLLKGGSSISHYSVNWLMIVVNVVANQEFDLEKAIRRTMKYFKGQIRGLLAPAPGELGTLAEEESPTTPMFFR